MNLPSIKWFLWFVSQITQGGRTVPSRPGCAHCVTQTARVCAAPDLGGRILWSGGTLLLKSSSTTKYERLTQCCINIDPSSALLARHQNNIKPMSEFCYCVVVFWTIAQPANTWLCPNVVSTLVQRLYLWPNVDRASPFSCSHPITLIFVVFMLDVYTFSVDSK